MLSPGAGQGLQTARLLLPNAGLPVATAHKVPWARVRHVSFHSLRHTNASLRIRAEQNIKYMSMQMGHSSVKITLDTYGHLFNDEQFNIQ
jgi:integrase